MTRKITCVTALGLSSSSKINEKIHNSKKIKKVQINSISNLKGQDGNNILEIIFYHKKNYKQLYANFILENIDEMGNFI